MRKNDIFEAEIVGYSSDGSGVCRINGRAVFVPRTIVGEVWQVKILKVTSSAVWGKAIEPVRLSPERRTPDCEYCVRCGGCTLRHMSYDEELRFKLGRLNDALTHIGRQTVQAEEIIGSDRRERYRNKGIYTVRSVAGELKSGFFAPRTHELVPVERCLLQNEAADRVTAAVLEFMRKSGIDAYDEKSRKGSVRHVFVRTAVNTADCVACIVTARGFGDKTTALTDYLRSACPELTGIVLNVNKTPGNTVLAGDFYTLWGRDTVCDSLGGVEYEISPQAFYQINPPQAEKLYNRAVEYAGCTENSTVLDLYCGAGTISLFLAKKAGRVIGAEIIPEAIENAKRNARRNGIENAEFICADAAEAAEMFLRDGIRPETVVVDPPRKGMDEEAIRTVCKMRPDRVVYVSCNPSTLARDILIFNAHGYTLAAATALDMFPRTSHCETVCLLVLRNPVTHINIDVDVEEMVQDKRGMATYGQIKDYVLEHSGLNVSSLYIAQVKQKHGIIERENYNKPKSEDARQPQCPLEKERAITEALKHFGML